MGRCFNFVWDWAGFGDIWRRATRWVEMSRSGMDRVVVVCATGVPWRPWFTALASTVCNIPTDDLCSVTLVSGGIVKSRLDNGGGK